MYLNTKTARKYSRILFEFCIKNEKHLRGEIMILKKRFRKYGNVIAFSLKGVKKVKKSVKYFSRNPLILTSISACIRSTNCEMETTSITRLTSYIDRCLDGMSHFASLYIIIFIMAHQYIDSSLPIRKSKIVSGHGYLHVLMYGTRAHITQYATTNKITHTLCLIFG